ncbi:hypothetical protein [Cognaticolwellia beringensis]|uniref:Uncharacterized protein n=1 Tax=Cognaticolwellia beringensis TaxID=1967665 RepID=A0A222G9W4_9GAMM|nr:hypothetical protein [Cognaticolwellia beringensis]ASP48591.1 hypothetical protein B5D82_12910 [Cognaticolwellia beringensis]
MNITDFCRIWLKAPMSNPYDWSSVNETSFFYLGWNSPENLDFKNRMVNVCASTDEAVAKSATQQLVSKMARERTKLFEATKNSKAIYYVLRVKQNPESDSNWSITAKPRPMSKETVVLKIDNLNFHDNGSVSADIIDRIAAKDIN